MNLTDKITITNEDCMELMSRYPDKYFELAIVDPPYGIKEDGQSNHSRGGPVSIGKKKHLLLHLLKNTSHLRATIKYL